jgi:hypothetical protein
MEMLKFIIEVLLYGIFGVCLFVVLIILVAFATNVVTRLFFRKQINMLPFRGKDEELYKSFRDSGDKKIH